MEHAIRSPGLVHKRLYVGHLSFISIVMIKYSTCSDECVIISRCYDQFPSFFLEKCRGNSALLQQVFLLFSLKILICVYHEADVIHLFRLKVGNEISGVRNGFVLRR